MILTLPGESERQVVVIADRDSGEGPGLASSAAATGALVEIAEGFGGARHSKTLVFVSASGGSDGAQGAREFARSYPERDLIDAAIAIEQPGAQEPVPPHVLPWSSDQQSTSIQLTLTAETAVAEQTDQPGDGTGLVNGADAARAAERARSAERVDRRGHRLGRDQLGGRAAAAQLLGRHRVAVAGHARGLRPRGAVGRS